MEPVYIFESPQEPSGSTLLGETLVHTLFALLIGIVLTVVILAPIAALNFRSIAKAFDLTPPLRYHQTFRCSAMPPTDAALRRWAASQESIESVKISRKGNLVTLDYRMASTHGAGPVAPPVALGYTVIKSSTVPYRSEYHDPFRALDRLWSHPLIAAMIIMSVIASEAGFLLACAWGLRQARRAGEAIPALFGGPLSKSILLGAGMGVVALLFGEVWSLLLVRVVGPSADIDGALAITRQFPLWAKFSMAALGTVLAPLGEEFFFRGFLFGRYAAAGRVRLGMVVSSLIFAAVHLDPYNFVAIFVLGMLLAWTYHRSGSLIASMTTHAVNNAVAFGILFTTHHV